MDNIARGIHLVDEHDMNTTSDHDMILELQNQVKTLTAMITRRELGTSPQSSSDTGDMPHVSAIRMVWLQIFHKPNLPPKARKNFSVWSLKFEVFINGVKKRETFNVKLEPPRKALKIAQRIGSSPNTIQAITDMLDEPDTLVGIIRAHPFGGGLPYAPNQIAVLQGHLIDKPKVGLMINGEFILFDTSSFGPARGQATGPSKWFSQYPYQEDDDFA